VQPGTVDELVRSKLAGPGGDRHSIGMRRDADDPLIQADLTVRLLDVLSQGVANPAKVNDPCRLNAYR
jgi:hypothetical protein